MKTILTSIIILIAITLNAQKTYLKIYRGLSTEETIMYPPDTKFELKNEHNYTILKNNNTPKVFIIDGNYKLSVYPTYKNTKDVYQLEKGNKIELVLTSKFEEIDKNVRKTNSHNITGEKTITDSKVYKGKKNIEFKLSNGIYFEYKDKRYVAKYNNEFIRIKGNYVVSTDIGTLKISFNPDNGETWWVFEDKK